MVSSFPPSHPRSMRSPAYAQLLAETYVGYYLCADIGVEHPDELLAAHAQVGTQGRGRETDEECLVADADIGGVVGDGGASNQRPRLHEPLLKQRSLQALNTHVTHDELTEGMNVSLEH